MAQKKPPTKTPKLAAEQNKAKKSKLQRSECTIPPRVSDEVLNRFTLGRNEYEADRIVEYVEWQCAKDKERVTYLSRNPAPLIHAVSGITS